LVPVDLSRAVRSQQHEFNPIWNLLDAVLNGYAREPRPFLLVFAYVTPHMQRAGAIHGGPRPQLFGQTLAVTGHVPFPKI